MGREEKKNNKKNTNLINVMSCICSPGLGHFQPASSPIACLPPPRAFPSRVPLATRALSKQREALHPLLRLPHHSHRALCWHGARCRGCEHLCEGRCASQVVAVLAGEGIRVLVTLWAAGMGADDAGRPSSLPPAGPTGSARCKSFSELPRRALRAPGLSPLHSKRQPSQKQGREQGIFLPGGDSDLPSSHFQAIYK